MAPGPSWAELLRRDERRRAAAASAAAAAAVAVAPVAVRIEAKHSHLSQVATAPNVKAEESTLFCVICLFACHDFHATWRFFYQILLHSLNNLV